MQPGQIIVCLESTELWLSPDVDGPPGINFFITKGMPALVLETPVLHSAIRIACAGGTGYVYPHQFAAVGEP